MPDPSLLASFEAATRGVNLSRALDAYIREAVRDEVAKAMEKVVERMRYDAAPRVRVFVDDKQVTDISQLDNEENPNA